jgi:O-antigen ligase
MIRSIDTLPEQWVSKNSIWIYLIITLIVSIPFCYGWINSPTMGIIGILLVLFAILCLGLGMKNFLFLLLLIRINLDAFHNQLNIDLTSYKSMSLPGVLGLLILGIGIFYMFSKKINFWKYPLVKAYSFFFLGCFLSLFFSKNFATSIPEMVELLSFIILFILVVDNLESERDIRRMIRFLILSSLVPLFVAFIQIFSNFNLQIFSLEPFFRVKSTLTHPNAYAFYLVMIIVLSMSIFLHQRLKFNRTSFFLLIVLLLLPLIFTYTRSAWIGLVLAIFSMGILQSRKLLIFAPLAFYGIVLVFPIVFQRFDPIFNPELFQYTSLAWRIKLWSASIPYFLSSPILGNGLGSFQLIGYEIDEWFAVAHNDYLRILVETGVIGFSGFILLLFSLFKLSIRTYKEMVNSYYQHIAMGFVCFLFAYGVMSFADNLFNHGGIQWYFWTYAGVIAAIYRLNKKE